MTVSTLRGVLTEDTQVKIFDENSRGVLYSSDAGTMPTTWNTYVIDFIEVVGFGIRVICHPAS